MALQNFNFVPIWVGYEEKLGDYDAIVLKIHQFARCEALGFKSCVFCGDIVDHNGNMAIAIAKIVGPVRIGAHARIGANAVVIADVDAGATVVGVPAGAVG